MNKNQINNSNNFLENLFKKGRLSTRADSFFVDSLDKRLITEYQKIYNPQKNFSFFSFNFNILNMMPAMAISLIIVLFVGLTYYSQTSHREIISINKSVNDLEAGLSSLDKETQNMVLDTNETISHELDILETM